MRKPQYLFCMVIGLALLWAGYVYHGNNSDVEIKNTLTDSTEAAYWEPTIYNTVNNLNGIAMTIKGERASSTGLTLIFENNSDREFIYSEYFCLEKEINRKWYQVPIIIDSKYGFNSVGHHLASRDGCELAINWEWLYGSLKTGKYRIVKDVQSLTASGKNDAYYLAAEFSIVSGESKQPTPAIRRIEYK